MFFLNNSKDLPEIFANEWFCSMYNVDMSGAITCFEMGDFVHFVVTNTPLLFAIYKHTCIILHIPKTDVSAVSSTSKFPICVIRSSL